MAETKKQVTIFKPKKTKEVEREVTEELEVSALQREKSTLIDDVETEKNSFDFFQIDFVNRLIKNIPFITIGSSTKSFLKVSPDFLLSGVLKADASVTSVLGSASETTLSTYTIPLNTISRNYTGAATSSGPRDWRDAGNIFRIHASGIYTTDDATANVAIALKVGSTTYHTITTTGATVTNAPWYIDWTFIVATIGSSGTTESFVKAQTNNVNKDSGGTSTIAIDTTADQAISLTATWASGDAGDTISVRQFMVELLN